MTTDDLNRVATLVISGGDGRSWENPPRGLLCRLLREFPEVERWKVLNHLDRTIKDETQWDPEKRESVEAYFGPRYFVTILRAGTVYYWGGADHWVSTVETAILHHSEGEAMESGAAPGRHQWDNLKDKNTAVSAVPYPDWTKCRDSEES